MERVKAVDIDKVVNTSDEPLPFKEEVTIVIHV
jgi:hypothetical protein